MRSSAGDEDGAAHSHAGQLDSFLDVREEDVPTRIADVWRSGHGARLLAYREQLGVSRTTVRPAVIVQRMVRAGAAGVAFSADPVSGRRGLAVVGAVRGHGHTLVSGERDADTWSVDRAGRISGRPTRGSGVLSDEQVQAVAKLARQAARHFGRPQDIEWACEAGALFLLQSRPITALAPIPDPDGTVRVWDNSNLVESYSGVTTPLTFSFASEAYEHVYRGFCRLMRVPAQKIAAHDDSFRNMIGLVRGRMYYNLANWYRVLALLPGFSLNRRFMEQMMGVSEGLAPPGRDTAGRPIDRVRDAGRLAWTAAVLLWKHLTIERQVRTFCQRLDSALAPGAELADMSADELVAHYEDLRRQLLHAWDAPIVNDFLAMIFHGVLRKLVEAWCDGPRDPLLATLLRSHRSLVSAEPARRLRRLALLADRDRSFVELLVSASYGRLAAAIGGQPEFDAEYRAYLESFGERTMNELKLETLTLRDDPLPLLRAAGQLALGIRAERDRRGASDDSNSPDVDAAGRQVDASMAWRPVRRALFTFVLGHARARLHDRERLRLDRTRLFGRVRRIFVELGRRLHADDLLHDPRDVFYLTVDEILAFVEGRSVSASLRELVTLRRREFLEYEQAPEPGGRLESVGFVGHSNAFRRPATPAERTSAGEWRQGLGCCAGIVRGPVRVVTDAGSVHAAERCVLVGTHTDPGWVLFFPSALAVVVERGSLLSHTAIVARELGIPSVVSVPDATSWLKNGDWVEVDGSTGRVQRVPAPSPVRLKPDATTGNRSVRLQADL